MPAHAAGTDDVEPLPCIAQTELQGLQLRAIQVGGVSESHDLRIPLADVQGIDVALPLSGTGSVDRGEQRDAATGDEGHSEGGEDSEIVAEIKQLLDSRIRPAVAQDGGDIVFSRFEADTGVVYLHMRGACSGCPSSSATLKAGVENMLKHYVPEVTRVEQTL